MNTGGLDARRACPAARAVAFFIIATSRTGWILDKYDQAILPLCD
jgi:hypothetical protein